MTAKRISIAAAVAALLALLAVGLVQLASSSSTAPARSKLTLAQMQARLASSPPALASLHAQASQLLPGGLGAFRTRLAGLHGEPIVINKWASWCVPCRSELGAFQAAAVALGRRVAFVGIDSLDTSHAAALRFLHSFPVPYPSYYDRSGALGGAVTDSSSTPVTVFYDSSGAQYIRQGPYPSAAKLEQDVRRYALDEKTA
ncbi:MAG TPA: TlpA disulfide reductase family protein [Solirubrobacteraceae bacterium]|jgi:cytochrome c biogenesis protein CcmG/thiol:disulfide interchange protein DsbE|nr:TlpA disulfide reductase family protein [Solirubrobacteraceae bacterium]